MVFYRVLLSILFCISPILLLNSIGKNINILDIPDQYYVIFNKNMENITHTDRYFDRDNIVEVTCDAIKKYDGSYISYLGFRLFSVPCDNYARNYNIAVFIMFLIILYQLLVFCGITYVFFHNQQTFDERTYKMIIYVILALFLSSIFCDVYSLSSDRGIAIFYGNKIYDISGKVYVAHNKYDINTVVYEAKFNDDISLSRIICDGTHFRGGRDEYFFGQMFKINKCDPIGYNKIRYCDFNIYCHCD